MWSSQELRGEIGHYACFLLTACFHGPHALLVYAIPDGQCQRCIDIIRRRCHRCVPEAAKEVVNERLPEIGNAHAGSDTYTG